MKLQERGHLLAGYQVVNRGLWIVAAVLLAFALSILPRLSEQASWNRSQRQLQWEAQDRY